MNAGMVTRSPEAVAPPVVKVAICTFRRNEFLRNLLYALQEVALATSDRARIAVVIVDDNDDGRAREVAEQFQDTFELGCEYVASGHGNISMARNLAINAGMVDSDWIAMIDDDCEPDPSWLIHYLDVLAGTGADCATGPMLYRPTEIAPQWLTDQGFFGDVRRDEPDRSALDVASTNNSIIRAEFLRAHPEVRFRPELGVLGGEDMVFYRTAHRSGLQIRFAADAFVWGNEPPERCTFRHQIRYRFWLGNTECVTNLILGDASRFRLAVRGLKRILAEASALIQRIIRRRPPHLRYTLASTATALGLVAGSLGLRNSHPIDGT